MTRVGGYTLLEMVVVVALLALATGMIAPAGYRMLASWQESYDVDRFFDGMRTLPLQARNEGRPIVIASDKEQEQVIQLPDTLVLPEDWSLQMHEPLRIRANGACSNAAGALTTARQHLEFRILSPYCRVERLPAGGA